MFPLIICLLPVIYYLNDGKLFFTQKRPGLNGKIFRVIKLRTMNEKRDHSGRLFPDKIRLTPVGRFLRSLSIDELPQLVNILKGEMSFVGPRPLLTEYLPLYNERQCRRHDVRPGLTGWAQVNGRNTVSWEEKFEMDVWYVENLSFSLDLKILFLTILKVIKREGIDSDRTVTMAKFKGTQVQDLLQGNNITDRI